MALADVRPEGLVTLHSHTQNPQALRGQIALMLGVPVEKVVIRTYSGAGHYGRSNGGNAGAEDEAVLLSKALGKPVRVQWMRADDLQWSTQSSAAYSDIHIGLDASGKIIAYDADHYMPAMQDDRLIGAVLAGLPTMPAPSEKAKIFIPPPTVSRTIGFTIRLPIWTSGRKAHGKLASTSRRSMLAFVITVCAHPGSSNKTSPGKSQSVKRRPLSALIRCSSASTMRRQRGLKVYWRGCARNQAGKPVLPLIHRRLLATAERSGCLCDVACRQLLGMRLQDCACAFHRPNHGREDNNGG